MRVDVWSDVVCPWCYIGKRRFEKALGALRERGIDAPVEVVYHSFQLDPGAPTGEPVPVREAYAAKFGGAARAEAILANVTGVAAAEGIEFRMDIALRSNTLLAHRALHFALREGAAAQSRLKEALLDAYFTRGLDVGDTEVVLGCARAADLDPDSLREWLDGDGGRAEVLADLEAARESGITAVPSFVIDDRFLVPGAQDVDTFVGILAKMLSR